MPIESKTVPVLSLYAYLSGGSQATPNADDEDLKRLLVVPAWQREYVWKPSVTGEVGILLSDLKDFIKSGDEEYLLGSIFLSKTKDNPNHRLIIDGQQRSLTLTVLFMSILRYIENYKSKILVNNDRDEIALAELTLTDLRNCISKSVQMYHPRISMPHSQADDILQSLYWWTKVTEGQEASQLLEEKDTWTRTQKNLVEVAFWVYEKQLKDEKWLTNSDLLIGVRKLLDNVKFLQITLSDEQEAIAIFDRINSRGARLNSGDLIKNRIFQSVKTDKQYDMVSKIWSEVTNNLSQCSLTGLKEPKFLLRALALAEQDLTEHVDDESESESITYSAPKITYNQLTTYWKNALTPKEGSGKIARDPVEFVEDLKSSSEWLKNISFESHANKPKKGKLNRYKSLNDLYVLRYMNSIQHFPIIMAGRTFENFSTLEHFAHQVHLRTLYYLLSEEATQTFESLVPTWTRLVSKLGTSATKEQLDEIYIQYVKVSEAQVDILIEQMYHWSYITDKNKIRTVLSTLSRFVDIIGGKEDSGSPISYFSTDVDANGISWDIDHIYPKKGVGKDSNLHLIGNLVLLKSRHNQIKKIASPPKKEDVYRDSKCLLTQNLVGITVEHERKKVEDFLVTIKAKYVTPDLQNWDSKAQKERANLYSNLLKHYLLKQ